jgi:hypothetical protein
LEVNFDLTRITINAMIKSDSLASAKPANKKPSLTLSGSSTNQLSLTEVIEKVRQINPSEFYVWDGQNPDDQALSQEQLAVQPCK